jgi:class 3 adenylate cyclase
VTSIPVRWSNPGIPGLGRPLDTGDIPLFSGVDSRLAKLVNRDMIRTYRRGDVLCHEGDPGGHMFAILRGRVTVTTSGENLAMLNPGDLVGEQSFVDDAPRNATVTAIGHVEALAVPHAVVNILLSDRAFVGNLLRALSRKVSEATRQRAARYRHESLLVSEFRAHLSDEVAQRLLDSGRDYGKPRRLPAVILFSDIRNFTPTSALLEPEEIASQLSVYFDETVDIIHSHGGMVDKFIGDAVMAVWGFVPGPIEDLALAAYRCGQSMIECAAARTFAGVPISIGVGVNSGEVFMGNVGGRGKRHFTVLGNPVNIAARLEQVSKTLDASLVVGAPVASSLPLADRAELRAHRDIPIKGAPNQTVYTWSSRSRTQIASD